MYNTSKVRGGGAQQAGGGERGRRGGPGRGERRGVSREGVFAERAVGPTQEVAVVVDRRPGVRVLKVSNIEQTSHRVIRIVYRVEFEDCQPIEFDRLGAARERSAEPPPERRAIAPETPTTEAAHSTAEDVVPSEPETTETAGGDPTQSQT
jgi:hypothetical protein